MNKLNVVKLLFLITLLTSSFCQLAFSEDKKANPDKITQERREQLEACIKSLNTTFDPTKYLTGCPESSYSNYTIEQLAVIMKCWCNTPDCKPGFNHLLTETQNQKNNFAITLRTSKNLPILPQFGDRMATTDSSIEKHAQQVSPTGQTVTLDQAASMLARRIGASSYSYSEIEAPAEGTSLDPIDGIQALPGNKQVNIGTDFKFNGELTNVTLNASEFSTIGQLAFKPDEKTPWLAIYTSYTDDRSGDITSAYGISASDTREKDAMVDTWAVKFDGYSTKQTTKRWAEGNSGTTSNSDFPAYRGYTLSVISYIGDTDLTVSFSEKILGNDSNSSSTDVSIGYQITKQCSLRLGCTIKRNEDGSKENSASVSAKKNF